MLEEKKNQQQANEQNDSANVFEYKEVGSFSCPCLQRKTVFHIFGVEAFFAGKIIPLLFSLEGKQQMNLITTIKL